MIPEQYQKNIGFKGITKGSMLYRQYHLLAGEDEREGEQRFSRRLLGSTLLALFSMPSLRRRRGGNRVLEDGTVATATQDSRQSRRVLAWRYATRVSLVLILVLFTINSFNNMDCSVTHLGVDHIDTSANITKGVGPIDCHSHNDYLQRRPLFDALRYGCISIEADVWLLEQKWSPTEVKDDRLYVAHRGYNFHEDHTLALLYLEPILDLIEAKNPEHLDRDVLPLRAVYEADQNQTFMLLIDLKSRGPDTFTTVHEQLQRLRDRGYLTYHDGKRLHHRPLTVVVTGTATLMDVLHQPGPRRDIFLDAPLDRLPTLVPVQGLNNPHAKQQPVGPPRMVRYDQSNSYYASASLSKVIGPLWTWLPTELQRMKIRKVVNDAHEQNLVVRIWDTPAWPKSRRNAIWNILEEEGVDLLNVDDLPAAANRHYKGRNADSPLWT